MRINEIHELLAEHEHTDLSLAAFAREKGVPAYRLYDARRRARLKGNPSSRGEPSSFDQVTIADSITAIGDEPIDLRLPSGIILSIQRDFDAIALRRVLEVLSTC